MREVNKLELNKSKNKQCGFSLVSVLMAASIMTVLGVMVSQTIIQQGQSVSYLEDRLAKVDFKNKMLSMFSIGDSCTNTLVGKSILDEQTLDVIKDQNDVTNIDLNTGTSKAHESLIIGSIDLDNIDTPNAPSSEGRMTLSINMERVRTGGGPKALSPVELSLRVRTGAAGLIESCTVEGGSGSADIETSCVEPITEHIAGPYDVSCIERIGGSRCTGGEYRSSTRIFKDGSNEIITYTVPLSSGCGSSSAPITRSVKGCSDGIVRTISSTTVGTASTNGGPCRM